MSFIDWYEHALELKSINGLPTLEMAYDAGRESEFYRMIYENKSLKKCLYQMQEAELRRICEEE